MKAEKPFEKWKKEHESLIKEQKLTLHLIRKSPLTMFGLGITIALLFLAAFPYLLILYPEDVKTTVNLANRLKPPSGEHPFGTDDMGRDVFSRVIYGYRVCLMEGLSVIIIAMAIGIPLGAVSGYKGGVIDEVIMRVTDIFFSIPSILLALVITAALGKGIINCMIALGAAWWPFYTRLVRGRVLSIREEIYIEAARAAGGSDRRIIFRHILPNCISVILVQSSMQIGYAILSAGGLGFLGVGAQAPTPEWGLMMGTGRRYLPNWWWPTIFPGLAMFITVLGFCLLGDGLRDVLDPKLRRR